jgi:ABC-type branched-subunit amino acid transport system ATPase component
VSELRTDPADSGKSEALRCEDVSVAYGGVQAVRGLTFEVPWGEVRAIIGPNGAGKTTLLDVLSGETRPDSGRVLFGGRDISRSKVRSRVEQGIVRLHQYGTGFGSLQAWESVAVGLSSTSLLPVDVPGSRDRRKRAGRELLARVGLEESAGKRVAEHSFGQQRRIAIAGMLATDGAVLLLDEPTAGLDPGAIEAMKRTITSLAARGHAVLLVEHDLLVVEEVATSITLMREGEIVSELSPAEVRHDRLVAESLLGA